jgi:plasmid stabilization system protein ParE
LRDRTPAAPASVQQAIEDVNQIIGALKEALDEMDEVLETLELAERQKTADEQEIESLRRSLRQLQRPRDMGRPSGRPPESQQGT